MAEQILWLNTLLAAVGALTLAIAPASLTRILGLPRAGDTFYPRLLAVTLAAIACALVAEGYGHDGLGIDGIATINLIGGGSIAALLLFGGLVMAKRGRWLLRGVSFVMLALGGAALTLT
ncbi:MAG: hypothetical protein AAFZ01_08610 [Pseudomonadota bacterium]